MKRTDHEVEVVEVVVEVVKVVVEVVEVVAVVEVVRGKHVLTSCCKPCVVCFKRQ